MPFDSMTITNVQLACHEWDDQKVVGKIYYTFPFSNVDTSKKFLGDVIKALDAVSPDINQANPEYAARCFQELTEGKLRA